MKRTILLTVLCLTLWCSLWASDAKANNPICLPQVFLDPNAAPVVIDLAKIALDPESSRKLILGYKYVTLGQTASISGKYCDPEGDPVTVKLAGFVTSGGLPTLTQGTGTYTISFKPTVAGLSYLTVSAVDTRPQTNDPKTRTGTWVLICVPGNSAPVLL